MTNVALVSIIRLGAGWRVVFRIVSSEEAQNIYIIYNIYIYSNIVTHSQSLSQRGESLVLNTLQIQLVNKPHTFYQGIVMQLKAGMNNLK